MHNPTTINCSSSNPHNMPNNEAISKAIDDLNSQKIPNVNIIAKNTRLFNLHCNITSQQKLLFAMKTIPNCLCYLQMFKNQVLLNISMNFSLGFVSNASIVQRFCCGNNILFH